MEPTPDSGSTRSSVVSRRGIRGAVVVLAVVGLTVLGLVVVRSRDGAVQVAAPASQGIEEDRPLPMTTIVPDRSIADFVDPDHPAAVGVIVRTFVDPTRGTEARGDRPELDVRPLTVTIRYPTPGMAGPDELADAPVYERAPLVLFAHGFDVSSSRYAALLHDLAASGYVVAAPEFPMTSSEFDGAPDEYDLPENSRDLAFLISALTGSAAPPDVAAMILPGAVGLVGHSDGAMSSLLAGYAPRFADDRVGAIVSVSGAFDGFGGTWFSTNDPPLLAVHSLDDEINPFASSTELVDEDPGPAMLVGVEGTSHLGSVTSQATEPAVASLIAWFLRWRLMPMSRVDAQRAAAMTRGVAVTSPLELLADHP